MANSIRFQCIVLFSSDNTHLVRIVLKEIRKSELAWDGKLRGQGKESHALATIATLQNAPEVLQYLIDSPYIFNPHFYMDGFGAAEWAEVLGYHECKQVLKSAGFRCEVKIITQNRFPPIVSLFYPKRVVLGTKRHQDLINELIVRGYSVNSSTYHGHTALYRIVKFEWFSGCYDDNDDSDTFDAVKCSECLVKHGADLFCFYSKDMIYRLLKVNIDIFQGHGDKSLIWNSMNTTNCLPEDLGLLLQCAHSVHPDDMVRLASIREKPNISDCVKDDVHKYLVTPKTLMRISVNSLRRHYGTNIANYVKQATIPKGIVPYILIEDLLSKLMTSW